MRFSTPLAAVVFMAVVALGAQQASGLKIVVLAGEGAVNIIQPQTAVRPLVEVRDRNNLPVAGATVTFSIGGGSGAAFAGGAQTLTVTTNAVGQAAASGLTVISSGAFQIQVQAEYQGQLATAAISQTNFATAAAAAQAAAGTGTGGTTGAAGGAAAGGGRSAGATIAIVGTAAGAGALIATQVGGSDPEAKVLHVFTGPVGGQLIFTSRSADTSCVRTMALGGSMSMELTTGGASGTADLLVTQDQVALTGPCSVLSPPPLSLTGVAVTGGPSALTFTEVGQSSGGGTTGTTTVKFTGAVSGNTVTGTVSIEMAEIGSTATPDAEASGSATFPVTLQKKQ
jgi:hypothetical protein